MHYGSKVQVLNNLKKHKGQQQLRELKALKVSELDTTRLSEALEVNDALEVDENIS